MSSSDSAPEGADGTLGDRPAPVLVVDDDARGAAETAATLVSGGYRVLPEAIGDAVLRVVRASLVHLVISEIYIPSSEGTCVVTSLKRERARLPRLRVLVHTRHASEEDVAWALDAGADTVVCKPAREGVLLRELRRLDGQGDAAA